MREILLGTFVLFMTGAGLLIGYLLLILAGSIINRLEDGKYTTEEQDRRRAIDWFKDNWRIIAIGGVLFVSVCHTIGSLIGVE